MQEIWSGAKERIELSIVMPCLNEAASLGECIDAAFRYLEGAGITGEVVVADNGSTDGSISLAESRNARVVRVCKPGYGRALRAGIASARGDFVIMGDSDGTYDFSMLNEFVLRLRGGADLVVGNRFLGGIDSGAMPALNRFLGNPVLTRLARLLFGGKCSDYHCGLRGFRVEAIRKLGLQSSGMEFASEMIVKSMAYGLKVAEVPTRLSPDAPDRVPHLRPWRDGWRHLRLLLLMSPRWLFLYPGLAGVLLGLLLMSAIFFGSPQMGGIRLGIHSMLFGAAALIIGTQSAMFSVLARIIAWKKGWLPRQRPLARWILRFPMEKGLCFGAMVFVCGLVLCTASLIEWKDVRFGDLNAEFTMRQFIPGVTALIAGTQIALFSLLIGVMKLERL